MINRKLIALIIVVTVFSVGVATAAQSTSALSPQSPVRLLLVDETKTFSSTMRVGILAGILKKTGIVDLSVKMVDVDSSYVDPLAGSKPPARPYDVILIIPRGIDNGSVHQIWLVTRGFDEISPRGVQGIKRLAEVIDKVFAKIAQATDVTEDLYPGLLSALYLKEGWL